jgi:hypothetical protein
MNSGRRTLSRLAATLIAASVLVGAATVPARLADTDGSTLSWLEATTLLLASCAYLAYLLAHHENPRELLTRSILVSAFALWAVVQLAPIGIDSALVNDVVIVLFVADLAILLRPWR